MHCTLYTCVYVRESERDRGGGGGEESISREREHSIQVYNMIVD